MAFCMTYDTCTALKAHISTHVAAKTPPHLIKSILCIIILYYVCLLPNIHFIKDLIESKKKFRMY